MELNLFFKTIHEYIRLQYHVQLRSTACGPTATINTKLWQGNNAID